MDARVTNEEILLHLHPSRSAPARLADGLRAVWWAVRHYAERRRAYEQLRALTDRELEDIGLARGDIGRVFEPEFRISHAIRATRTA
jgi:uncharacterized protein YjiS (DUF1127 family)